MSIDRLVGRLDPVPTAPELDEGARELCAEITARPREAVRSRRRVVLRWRVALPLAAAALAVTLGVTLLPPGTFGLGPRPASAALDIHRADGYYVITVRDLFADPARYQTQLRSRGLTISLRVVPVTPAAVGQPFVMDPAILGLTDAQARLRKDLITATYRPGHCDLPQGCAIGLKIPVAYTGHAVVYLGRQARPGESYRNPMQLDAVGGPLHCVAWLRKTVDQVRTLLRDRGVPDVKFATARDMRTEVPGSWYVHDGVLSGPGKATLLVGPTLKRPDAPGPVGAHSRQGC